MRKFLVVAATAVAVLGITAVAYAVTNTYSSTSKVTPSKSGTSAKPAPVSAALTFHVGEVSNQRPSALKTYSIGLGPGVVPNTAVAPGCSFNQAAGPILPAACKGKSVVGGGSVSAYAGLPADASVKLPCFLTVTLINGSKKNHLNIRIDGVTSGPAGKTCVASQHTSIDAQFVKTGTAAKKGGGTLPVWAIKFSVPDSLLHPPGLVVAVYNNVSNVKKISKKIKGVNHGYLETIGCPKAPSGKRDAVTKFTAENGQSQTSHATSACKT
jgi:hypothetical protein